jgi:FkbM family methyltransferase
VQRPEPYRGWRRPAAAALRAALRAYIRFAPWNAFKIAAYDRFHRYIAWQPYAAVTRTRFGFRMLTQISDLVSCVIYLTGQWEPFLTALLRERLRPGDVFVDVGANIGYYSLLASQLVGSRGQVYCIEASPTIYSALLANIALNERGNITPLNAAAADKAGELAIWLADETNRGHSTTVSNLAQSEGMTRESLVRANTIAELVGPQVLRRARIVKVDVEGAERTVLAPLLGVADSLGTDTEWLIELTPEYSENGLRDTQWIFDAFTALGYSAYQVPNSYDILGFLARPRRSSLTPVTQAPMGQADILFRRERPHPRSAAAELSQAV